MRRDEDELGKIKLEWINNVEPDLKEYLVFKQNEQTKEFVQIGKSNVNSYLDSLKLNNKNIYTIKAIDTVGNASLLSNNFKVNAIKTKNKSESLYVKTNVKKKGKTIKLDWKKNKFDSPIKGYVVFYNTDDLKRQKTKLLKDKKYKLIDFNGSYILVKAFLNDGSIIKSNKISF